MRALTRALAALSFLLALPLGGCIDGITQNEELPGFEDFVDGKSDTGYVGNRAAELEAELSGRVRVLLPDKSPEELATIADEIRENPRSWDHRDITIQVTEQLKYARNALKSENLDLNLEGGTPTYPSIEVVEGGLDLTYSVTVESLVKFKDLEERGLTPQDLVGKTIDAKLPLIPEGLFERTSNQCATDDETGEQPAPEDLGAHNLFYYFDPGREGCPLTDADLNVARYVVHSSLDAPTVYPEYDQLTADGKISMVAIFGQIKHGELSNWDWGFISFRTFTNAFQRMGFQKTETFDNNRGHQLKKTYPGGLEVVLDMYTPVDFADDVPREQSNEAFRAAMRTHEIVYYNGHAFYGSLKVLDEPTAYPADTYQVIFMDACWSYAYYTKQVFRNKATESDPDGYELADVVNNTEPGITGSEETAAVLYENMLKGAAEQYVGSDPSIYSWNNIIEYMNAHAEARAENRTSHPNPEIYGASGVVTNRYDPTGAEPPIEPTGNRFENNTAVEIPDNDENGVTSTIEVPSGVAASDTVVVEVNIEHTYVGDLTVTLEHAGRSVLLHDRTGGSTDNLTLRVAAEDFAGVAPDGTWSLSVADHANLDSGRLDSWAIALGE